MTFWSQAAVQMQASLKRHSGSGCSSIARCVEFMPAAKGQINSDSSHRAISGELSPADFPHMTGLPETVRTSKLMF